MGYYNLTVINHFKKKLLLQKKKKLIKKGNRISNYNISNSIDSGVKEWGGKMGHFKSCFHENNNNNSLYDPDNSVMNCDEQHIGWRLTGEQKAQDQMKSLAGQLGEYFLTVDLGCLLAQKRKRQLDQVAKMAVFEEVDSIMDLKIDEKALKERMSIKKRLKMEKKKQRQPLGDKLKLLDSASLRELNNSNEDLSLASSKSQIGVENSVQIRKSKKNLKILQKFCRILFNLIYKLLREFEIERLNFVISPVNFLFMYISSQLSGKVRQKDAVKMALSSAGWVSFQEIDFEFGKLDDFSQGIDNLENINRHYEKTLFEKYKAIHKNSMHNNQRPQQQQHQQHENLQPKLNKNPQDSTVLYFSTTFDYTNSSILTFQEDSIDSIDELNLNERVISLDHILLPETMACFKIIDIYSVKSEKTHEYLSSKINLILEKHNNYQFSNNNTDNFSKDDDREDILTNLREENQNIVLGNLKTERNTDNGESIMIWGLQLNNMDLSVLKKIHKASSILLFIYFNKYNLLNNNLIVNNNLFINNNLIMNIFIYFKIF